MALGDEIRGLRERALAELVVAHDYYTDSRAAWLIVKEFIQAGNKITIRNLATGSVTREAQLTKKVPAYVAEELAQATFQQFVSIFENFFFDLLRLWLVTYPQSLGSKELLFKTVLDAPDKDSITFLVVNKELNELAYERPREWFAYLEARARLGCPTAEQIERISEAKASRDVLAHNRGIANKIYESKAGQATRYKDGERLKISQQYHRETWKLFRDVITELSAAALAKSE